MNKTAAPKLRFPEFQDAPEWKMRPLGEIMPITSSKRVHQSEWAKEGIPFYRAREIVALNNGEPISPLFISEELYITNSNLSGEIKTGDLLVTGVGSIGVPYLVKDDDRFYFKDGNIIWLQNNGQEIIGKFLYLLYESEFIQKQITTMAGVGTVGTYTIDNAKKTIAVFPKNQAEQQKIADCLTSLDELITAQSQKVETLQAYKKGLMQNLFPAEGESVPRLRFPEFESAGEWEEKTIAGLDIYVSDGNYGAMYPRAEEMKESGVPFIRANNIKDSRLVWDDMKYIDADLHTVLESGHLEENDILVTTRGNIGMVAYVTKEFHGANINAQICLLRCGKSLNSYYLLQYLLSENCYKQFMALQTGSALKQLPKKNLGRIKIYLPLLPEQQRIAEFLTLIDEQISTQSETVEMLKSHKRGLMQGLFPSVGGDGAG